MYQLLILTSYTVATTLCIIFYSLNLYKHFVVIKDIYARIDYNVKQLHEVNIYLVSVSLTLYLLLEVLKMLH